jgi:hypothetical protein
MQWSFEQIRDVQQCLVATSSCVKYYHGHYELTVEASVSLRRVWRKMTSKQRVERSCIHALYSTCSVRLKSGYVRPERFETVRSPCKRAQCSDRTHGRKSNIESTSNLKQTNIPLLSSSHFFALCLPPRSLELQQEHHNRRSRHQLHCRPLRTSHLAYRPPLRLVSTANHV